MKYLKPRVQPNICQERKVLCCMLLEKNYMTSVFHFGQKKLPKNDGMEKNVYMP